MAAKILPRALAVFWFIVGCAAFAATNEPPFIISDFVICGQACTNAPHDWHIPNAVFRTDSDRFFAWVELREVAGPRPVTMKLYRPDGSFLGEETQLVNGPDDDIKQWWRMSAWWRISGDKPAETPGRWRLDLVIDGLVQRSLPFDILPVEPLKAALKPAKGGLRLTTVASTDRICVVEASTNLVHWTPIHTNNAAGTLDWYPPIKTNIPTRFYRVVEK